ncbi:MAG TPA: FHA domain-containing protein [Actinomycetota bacterium]|nr:FHA domain-containing protein [Actinomycetota bacterium]
MRRVVFTNGPLAGRQVEVAALLVLGREAADLAIDDPEVSRRHAGLRPAGDGLEIEDLGSLNGTWVNGTRIQGTVRLSPGDRIQLGATSFEVQGERAQQTVASPRPAARMAEREAFSPPAQRGTRRRPTVASRRLTPTLLSFAVVIATAIALVLYFAMR